MADIGDIQATFENGFFRSACQDVARIVSVLSLDSTDVTKSRKKITKFENAKEKIVFFARFFYMVFIKGFTPTVFDVLPYWFWRLLTTVIFLYRLFLLPFWLRMTGYLKYADWSDLGSRQPKKDDPVAKPLKAVPLTKESNLAAVDFADPDYEKFITQLYRFTTHLSPHSQSPLNPFVHNNLPGNFFDHLTGVYKGLLAWKQPQYVVRAGLFHSVYGTFDYRYSLYDLREGREPLRSLVGPASEELAFAICTSDRIGLLHRIAIKMYGHLASMTLDGSSASLEWMYGDKEDSHKEDRHSGSAGAGAEAGAEAGNVTGTDGRTYPKLISVLGPEGFQVQNHITQKFHWLSPDLFAQYGMVMLADFMEQGVVALGAPDSDICMFRFMRYRFWADFVVYLSPYLRVVPPVFAKYMGKGVEYLEPTREEVESFKGLWMGIMNKYHQYAHGGGDKDGDRGGGKDRDRVPLTQGAEFRYMVGVGEGQEQHLLHRQLALDMTRKYPYLAEPFIALAALIAADETYEVCWCDLLSFY
jgi:hypothetical protein